MINTTSGDIILDCQIKTRDGWVAVVNFLQAFINKRAVSATVPLKKNVIDLHVELGRPSKAITRSTAKGLGIQVTGMFKPCEDCALGKAKQSSPFTPTFGGKPHWLLVINGCSNWSFFLKESLI